MTDDWTNETATGAGRVPDHHVVRAFGGEPERLTKLAGGQGGSWRAGAVVLKPAAVGETERISWLAGILDQVPEPGKAGLGKAGLGKAGLGKAGLGKAEAGISGPGISGAGISGAAISGAAISGAAISGAAISGAGALGAGTPGDGDFRLARPVPAGDGRWIVGGWAATRWVEGEHRPGLWKERLAVSSALHAALAGVPADPGAFQGQDPWSVGMRVAWGRQPFDPARYASVAATYDELRPLLDRPWAGPPPQVIHGDLCGNIVFADGLPPGVIDFSPHLAPAPFADAIIIADGIAWENAPVELAVDFAVEFRGTGLLGASLLARAVLFRVVSAAHAAVAAGPEDAGGVRHELDGYRPVLDVLRSSTVR